MSGTYSKAQLVKVAKLYYLGNLSQEDIGKIIGVSRPMVSRMLAAARERKIVRFEINASCDSNIELAKKIKTHFALKYVFVVPSSASEEDSKREVGRQAGDFLNSQLKNDMVIGTAWGSTIGQFVHAFKPEKSVLGATVLQLAGSLNAHSFETDSRDYAKELAQKLDARLTTMQTPFVVGNQLLRDLLLQEPETKHLFDMFHKIDIAFVGVGSSKPEKSATYQAGYITKEEAQVLVDMGAGADICGHRITRNGHKVETLLSDRILSISLDVLKELPLVVALGAGEDKSSTIIAGVRGGYLNALIIDELAAISIAEKEKIR